LVVVRDLGLLAIYLYREDRESALKTLDELYGELPEEVKKELEDTVRDMRDFIEAGQWDDAWDKYQVLVDAIGRYDPLPPRGAGLERGTAREGEERGRGKPLTEAERVARHREASGEVRVRPAREVLEEKRRKIAEALHIEPDAIDISIDPEGRVIAKIHYYRKAESLDDIMKDREELEKLGYEVFSIFVDEGGWLALGAVKGIPKVEASDPVLSAYVTRETREAYEKAARPEETVSYYARKVLEGERSPAVPPDGIVARRRVMEAVREAEEEPEYMRRIREHIEAWKEKSDWEKELEELTKPVEVDWEKRLKNITSNDSGDEADPNGVEEVEELPEEYEAMH